ncbi:MULTISPECIES: substrate-binding and VWA domain-containing protein [Thermomonospora]|uniref:von Willebrand factor type A n=1 Tax=Thermomonospora curvata (strain ATCC 19995 / DSM 43183 / JCM 3096 / KCTC 9072 / NBRC 15933 / NCIMB 10081 / Henssen B9) TaxID=471852 RepID=D1A9E8_THECD|nr:MULTISPECIES: substrate-binding and VWA domain-containing protein [Thermomonospora]ACY96844.1 von Willebrand factor type A [Thermomonospora curvata DSM 43183]PKK15137.1 MAG: VWA domain-containing protein [Thermomonospora sp. CIF 1]
MSGRHRNDLPEEPGNGGHDAHPSSAFGPAGGGSSDWFSPRERQSPPPASGGPGSYGPQDDPLSGPTGRFQEPGGASPAAGYGGYGDRGPAGGSGEYGPPGERSPAGGHSAWGTPGRTGENDIPDWFSAPPERRSAQSSGAFSAPTGPREPSPAEWSPHSTGGHSVPPGAGASRASDSFGASRPEGPGARDSGAFAGGGFGSYETISRSDGGPTRGGGSGGSGRSGGGSGSGEYDYGERRRKRNLAALIGPMAGAVGLAVLLGVGVYAFAGAGGGCGGDDALKLDVAVAPEIKEAADKMAGRFNEAKHKVDDKCVQVAVRSADPSSLTALLSGQAVENETNRRPDVWIPDSSAWLSLVRLSEKGKNSVRPTKTSLAQTPIVVAMPQTLAASLRRQGVISSPSWDNLLAAVGALPGGAQTKNQVIPAGSVRLFVPDPTRNAVGLTSLLLANILLANDPNREAIFTGMTRTMRENTTPSVAAQFASFRRDRKGRYPMALTHEQSVWAHNRGNPSEPAVAIYPSEGTLNLDYPMAVVSTDAAKQRAAGLLEQAINSEPTREDVRALGFRSADGKAPSTFGTRTGVSPQRLRLLPTPQPATVQELVQAWSKLSLSIRMLSIIDISGSMLAPVGGGLTRMQATARVAQGGLSLLPNDSELGQWVFSTKLDGDKDYKEIVPMGPLGERVGSVTRRQLLLSSLSRIEPKPTGDTGLYDTILAAYRYMSKTYKPEFGNSILLFTDGKNEDDDGPTLRQTLRELESMIDPTRPIQVIMLGFGPGVDVNELKQIAKVTRGDVYVTQNPNEIQKIFLQALSKRMAN